MASVNEGAFSFHIKILTVWGYAHPIHRLLIKSRVETV